MAAPARQLSKRAIAFVILISAIGIAMVIAGAELLSVFRKLFVGVPCVSTTPLIVGTPRESQPIHAVNVQNIEPLYEIQGNGAFRVHYFNVEHIVFTLFNQSLLKDGSYETCGYLSRLTINQQTVHIDQLTTFAPVRRQSNASYPLFVTFDELRNVFIDATGQVWNSDYSEIVNRVTLPQEVYPLSNVWFDKGTDRYIIRAASAYYSFDGDDYSQWQNLDLPVDPDGLFVASHGMIAYETEDSIVLVRRNGRSETILSPSPDASTFSVVGLSFSPDGRFLIASVDYEGTIVWDTVSLDQIMTVPIYGGSARFDLESNRALICVPVRCAIIDIAERAVTSTFAVDEGLFPAIAIHPSENFFALGKDSGDIEFRSFTGELLHRLSIGDVAVRHLAFTQDARQLLVIYGRQFEFSEWEFDRTGLVDAPSGIKIFGITIDS